MVIAEAPELDPGLVVAIILIALGSLLAIAAITGLVGVAIGVAIARHSQSPAARLQLQQGKRVWIGIVGVGATVVSWILLLSVGAALSRQRVGAGVRLPRRPAAAHRMGLVERALVSL